MVHIFLPSPHIPTISPLEMCILTTFSFNIGEIRVTQGRWAEAEAELSEAVRLLRGSEFPEGVAFAEIELARLALGQDRPDDAATLLARGLREGALSGSAVSEHPEFGSLASHPTVKPLLDG